MEPYINCQQCYSCTRGHTNCCEHHQTLGVHCDGGLQRLYTLPARKLHRAPRLSSAQCALVETLAIGCHAVDRGAPKAGETILVIGAGPIGLSALEFAKLSGAQTIVIDTNAKRLEFVREAMGVETTFLVTPEGAHVSEIERATDGRFCDVVIDATGSVRSMTSALNLCAFAGRLVYVGITQDELVFPHAPVMHRRELTLLASRNALSRDFTRIIDLIGTGAIDTRPWITHRASFDEMVDSFAGWLRPESGVIKAVVELDG
ncbi:MAG: zinc-binding dehydrogenase [Pirellulaceae bacterium]